MGWLRKIGRKIGKGIKKLGKAIGKGFKKVFKVFGDLGPIGHLALMIVFPAFTGFWGTLGKGIQGISKLSPALGKVFQTVYNIGSSLKGVYNTVTGALTNTLKKIPGVGQALEGSDKFIDRARQMIGIDAGPVPLADKEDITEYWNSMSDKELEKLQLSRTDLFVDGKLTEFGENVGKGKMFVEQMSERGFGTVAEIEEGYNFTGTFELDAPIPEGSINRIRMEDYAAFAKDNLNNLPSSYKYNFEQKVDSLGRKSEWEWVKKPVITPEGPATVKAEDFKPVWETPTPETEVSDDITDQIIQGKIGGASGKPLSSTDRVKSFAWDQGTSLIKSRLRDKQYADYLKAQRRGVVMGLPENVASQANYVQDLRPQFINAGYTSATEKDFYNNFIHSASWGPETYDQIMARQPIGTDVYHI